MRGRPKHNDVLTPGEWRIVHAVKHGMTSGAIARRRGISVDAVKYHVVNALAKLGLANRKALRLWHQALQGSALQAGLGKTEQEESTVNNSVTKSSTTLGALAQIARSVKDIKASADWYAQKLGLPHLYTFGTLAFFDLGGVRLMLSEAAKPLPESILYLRVADIVATCERLKAAGVEFSSAPHLIHTHVDGTEEWLAIFKDLEERALALMSQVRVRGSSGDSSSSR